MKDSLIHFISQFDKFTQEEINAIVENTQLENFKKGTTILREGQICTKCFFVIEGCLRQYQIVNGEEKTTAFFCEGEAAVLYSSYLEKKPSKYYLSTIENSILTTGTRTAEKELHKKYPKLENLINTLMPNDYVKSQEHIELLSHYSPEERYQTILKKRPELLNRIPLHLIASYIGVTPESLSRIRKRILTKGKSE
ncbi:cyclic nucleotide-binding protein [Polaribacter reichenbachii]|uniref:Cyclic nucleotide-binding protein n=1 Tax=Polaribacter reichenbachii TaxID=996801 RepID=A0A1B8U2L8_9FLAO|nr:Crp/Fnr family transcriptional regulator [Polaribacter reichenbachii]APZ48173.1 cyclic nucleotide-binding protein [Polaribacter reichenbachii]AUC20442.1 cyclic nucleotide-binding protein [Polaribacter reichenbachii]OBY66082.1 cyclic nucleotide-binding protein [Polaribacter reichenbachii]